jgi:uncharacterized protein YegP (UPF0339 family)
METLGYVEVYETSDGWRWRIVANNHEVVALGEAHTTEGHARRAVDRVLVIAASIKEVKSSA